VRHVYGILVPNPYQVATLVFAKAGTDESALKKEMAYPQLLIWSLEVDPLTEPVGSFIFQRLPKQCNVNEEALQKQEFKKATMEMITARPSILVCLPQYGVAICELLAIKHKREQIYTRMVAFTEVFTGSPIVAQNTLVVGSGVFSQGFSQESAYNVVSVRQGKEYQAQRSNIADGVTPDVLFIHCPDRASSKANIEGWWDELKDGTYLRRHICGDKALRYDNMNKEEAEPLNIDRLNPWTLQLHAPEGTLVGKVVNQLTIQWSSGTIWNRIRAPAPQCLMTGRRLVYNPKVNSACSGNQYGQTGSPDCLGCVHYSAVGTRTSSGYCKRCYLLKVNDSLPKIQQTKGKDGDLGADGVNAEDEALALGTTQVSLCSAYHLLQQSTTGVQKTMEFAFSVDNKDYAESIPRPIQTVQILDNVDASAEDNLTAIVTMPETYHGSEVIHEKVGILPPPAPIFATIMPPWEIRSSTMGARGSDDGGSIADESTIVHMSNNERHIKPFYVKSPGEDEEVWRNWADRSYPRLIRPGGEFQTISTSDNKDYPFIMSVKPANDKTFYMRGVGNEGTPSNISLRVFTGIFDLPDENAQRADRKVCKQHIGILDIDVPMTSEGLPGLDVSLIEAERGLRVQAVTTERAETLDQDESWLRSVDPELAASDAASASEHITYDGSHMFWHRSKMSFVKTSNIGTCDTPSYVDESSTSVHTSVIFFSATRKYPKIQFEGSGGRLVNYTARNCPDNPAKLEVVKQFGGTLRKQEDMSDDTSGKFESGSVASDHMSSLFTYLSGNNSIIDEPVNLFQR
jgi:hypothetical protein